MHSLSMVLVVCHQIDFSPGATIPNHLSYRINPKKTKELQCQVEELIVKVYIA